MVLHVGVHLLYKPSYARLYISHLIKKPYQIYIPQPMHPIIALFRFCCLYIKTTLLKATDHATILIHLYLFRMITLGLISW